MKTYTEAMKKLPRCCKTAVENYVGFKGETVQSIIAGVELELTMYAVDQDYYISAMERNVMERNDCVRYLKWLRTE